MAEQTQNSINQVWVNETDGFTIKGGTTERSLIVTGGNVEIEAAGTAEVTFPSFTTTLLGKEEIEAMIFLGL